MTELLTAAQMRAIEQAAIASGEVTGLELMERAGRGVVDSILEWRPELATAPHKAVVLCGPGNNGGDGFVVARMLHERGWEVEVFLYGDEKKLPPDARDNHRRWSELGTTRALTAEEVPGLYGLAPDIWIDAILGTGLTRRVDVNLGGILRHVAMANMFSEAPGKVVAVDVPTGLDSDSGRWLFDWGAPEWSDEMVERYGLDPVEMMIPVPADLTVTFHSPRVGHFLGDAPGYCGRLSIVDIGLVDIPRILSATPEQVDVKFPSHGGLVVNFYARDDVEDPAVAHEKPRTGKISLADLFDESRWDPAGYWGLETPGLDWQGLKDSGPLMPLPLTDLVTREELGWLAKHEGHKYDHGHAVILSGGVGKGGAARLAARGALRVGAGLVTLCPPPAAIIENAAQLNSIMLRPVADADALAEILKDERFNAVGLGPGLGVGAHTLGLVAATLAAKRGTVLDADALTSFAEDPAKLFALLHEACVLTPHMGEFARLFPDIAAKPDETATSGPAYSKVDAAREAAARAGCVILLKGPDTVIADPQGNAAINSAHYERAAPWLATAGAGDVLTGMITGLLARGFAPMHAAEMAAWLHVEAARKFGPGLIAEDLPEMLPAVFRDLGL